MVDGPDVVHLKQLTGGKGSSRRSESLRSQIEHFRQTLLKGNIAVTVPPDAPADLLQEGPATDKLLALAVRRSKMPAQKKTVTSVILAREEKEKKKKTTSGMG